MPESVAKRCEVVHICGGRLEWVRGAGFRSRGNEKRPPTRGDLFTGGHSGVPRRPRRTANRNGAKVPIIDALAKCADECGAEAARAS